MREIKFRVYEKEKDGSINVIEWEELIKIFKTFDELIDKTFDEKDEEWITMQYTGLKDINGVEIYEGDVVKLDKKQHGDSDWSVNAVVKYDETPLFDTSGKEVEDYYNGWNIHSKGNEIIANRAVLPLNSIWADYFGLQIIGSVYENPELLEVE